MYELNDLRTRGVETWVQTQEVEREMSDEEARHKEEAEEVKKEARRVEAWSQAQKVFEKKMSDEEASHKEEIKKVEESRKKGRKEKLKKIRNKLEKAQKAQIGQLPQAKEIARKVQIQADICIRLTRALRMKKKNVGLKLPQFQYKDVCVKCIESSGKYMNTKLQEVGSSEEVEVKEDEHITFPVQETTEKEDEERLKEREEEIEEVEELKKDEKKMYGDEARCSKEAESDEECKKFTLQARPKVPMADRGMIHARYKIKHKVIKHQEEWRVDKHSAKSRQIASMECLVPAVWANMRS